MNESTAQKAAEMFNNYGETTTAAIQARFGGRFVNAAPTATRMQFADGSTVEFNLFEGYAEVIE